MTNVVHVVDDDAALRESLAFLLSTVDIECRTYELAKALLERDAALEPGCVVTDVRMPGMSGMELIAELKKRNCTHPIIVLTGHADVPLAVDAMKAGVSDFLEKPFEDEALIAAVRAALQSGETGASRDTETAELQSRLDQLTQREHEVFDAIVAGDSNKAAALKLGISPRTVEIYRANVMTKMKAQSLSELVRLALRLERG